MNRSARRQRAHGAILGSLPAGFVLLEWLGVWGSVQIIAVTCRLLALRSAADRRLPVTVAAFHPGSIASVHGDAEKQAAEWAMFLRHWLAEKVALR